MIIHKHKNSHTHTIENELRHYLPKITIETDVSNGDVVFRTNQQPNEQFIKALYHLETMKSENRIKNYGVQNSTMDDVFLKITRNTKKDDQRLTSTVINMDTIGL